jgi:hypothetical protein
LLHDYDVEPPIFLMSKALKFYGKYEEALDRINDVLKKHPNVQEGNWHEQKLELEALIKARNANLAQPIYEHVRYLLDKHKEILPPQNCVGPCDSIFSTIVRLYDHMGDYDAGMKFTDEFLQFYKKIGPGNPYQPGNQYFQVKWAFEQEKQEGWKGCVNAKAGEVCMGRATKALIQSDYFSW